MNIQVYKKLTNKDFTGLKAVTLRPLVNSLGTLPTGSTVTILRKYNGFEVVSEGCGECGIKLRITRLHWSELELQ